MNSSHTPSQLHEEHDSVPYRPMAITQREQDIITICSYTWSQLGNTVRFTFPRNEFIYRLAAEFVDVHQLPSSEYGIGESKEKDWDEHVEEFMLKELKKHGLL